MQLACNRDSSNWENQDLGRGGTKIGILEFIGEGGTIYRGEVVPRLGRGGTKIGIYWGEGGTKIGIYWDLLGRGGTKIGI